jgi:hypothetical protein
LRSELSRLKGCCAGEPCFILGNSPYLPTDLSCLDGFLTIGVNRIVRVHDPDILVILDASAFQEADKGTAQLLLSEEMPVKRQGGAWYPKLVIASTKWPADPSEIHANGNSGVAAAAWANTLGCEPIYLLGMEARYSGDRSNFYGRNKWHQDGTVQALGRALDNLLNAFPHCIPLDEQGLKEAVKKYKPRTRAYWTDLWQRTLTKRQ